MPTLEKGAKEEINFLFFDNNALKSELKAEWEKAKRGREISIFKIIFLPHIRRRHQVFKLSACFYALNFQNITILNNGKRCESEILNRFWNCNNSSAAIVNEAVVEKWEKKAQTKDKNPGSENKAFADDVD